MVVDLLHKLSSKANAAEKLRAYMVELVMPEAEIEPFYLQPTPTIVEAVSPIFKMCTSYFIKQTKIAC